MKLKIAGLLTLLVVALAVPLGAKADHEWMRWGARDRLVLEVGNNMDPRWHPQLEAAVAGWSVTDHGNPVRLKIVPGAGNPDCGIVPGRIEICNWDLGPTGWSGATWAEHDEQGNVTAMRIIINDYYHPDDEQWDRAKNRQWIVCHELGHALGLDHFDEAGVDLDTCMDYSDNIAPNEHDFEQLVAMYGRWRPSWNYWIRIGVAVSK